jgi:hypothetical protein
VTEISCHHRRVVRLSLKLSPETPERRFLGNVRAAGLIALMVGAAGSFGLFLRAGQRTPRLLLVSMAIWVLSAFIVLMLANVIAKRWSRITRATLYVVMLVVALGSLVVYGDDAMGHRRPQAAFVYVLVPPVCWLLITIAVATAASSPAGCHVEQTVTHSNKRRGLYESCL